MAEREPLATHPTTPDPMRPDNSPATERAANPQVFSQSGVENAPRPARLPDRLTAPTFHVAGFWRRAAAGALDAMIILPVAAVMCWLAGALAGISLPASRHHGVDFWLDLILATDPALVGAVSLTLAIATIYALVFQLTLARTPGMRALKIRIIDVYGDPPGTLVAILRTVGYLADAASLGLGFLWIGFDSEKRGLHDWISRTYVVKA
jgi:uncharacterized RDD family membrane protein YckC